MMGFAALSAITEGILQLATFRYANPWSSELDSFFRRTVKSQCPAAAGSLNQVKSLFPEVQGNRVTGLIQQGKITVPHQVLCCLQRGGLGWHTAKLQTDGFRGADFRLLVSTGNLNQNLKDLALFLKAERQRLLRIPGLCGQSLLLKWLCHSGSGQQTGEVCAKSNDRGPLLLQKGDFSIQHRGFPLGAVLRLGSADQQKEDKGQGRCQVQSQGKKIFHHSLRFGGKNSAESFQNEVKPVEPAQKAISDSFHSRRINIHISSAVQECFLSRYARPDKHAPLFCGAGNPSHQSRIRRWRV